MNDSKRSAIMKMEAMSLFANIRAQAYTNRWWYFREMKDAGHPVHFDQNLSVYRASLHWDYVFRGIECQIFLEREAHVGQPGENLWTMSFNGIEGKVKALTLHDILKPLQAEGYYIPNGNENLERQMNFSLGLYGACLMHVDVKFPINQPPVACALHVLDVIENANESYGKPLCDILEEIAVEKTKSQSSDEEEDPDIIMGDWQTWK